MMSKKARKRVEWFACGGGILQCGPFSSQIEAVQHMRLIDDCFPRDVFVWPEETAKTVCRPRARGGEFCLNVQLDEATS